jgi:uncharacterized protein YecE (DUF72 family)
MEKVRIGISGWNYAGWRGQFYPPKLPHRQELAYAAGKFRSIEINGTFHSLKRPQNFAVWVEETPRDFVFSVKGSRYITHMLRLKNVTKALANFCVWRAATRPKIGSSSLAASRKLPI